MTPAARLAAAAEILDDILLGTAPEPALSAWGRGHRFAGSGDRQAIRDHVFAALRCRSSFAALGGALTGRGLIAGGLRDEGLDPAQFFTGEGHAPAPLSGPECTPRSPAPGPESLDCPPWLWPLMQDSLGDQAVAVLQAMRARAPIFLRAHAGRGGQAAAAAALAAEGIETRPHPLSPWALEVVSGAGRLRASRALAEGLVEPQDAASQAVIAALPPLNGLNVLDYCAGGGGKALAMAALGARVTAHDISAPRMRDLPERARRAGLRVALAQPGQAPVGQDLVLVDAPCSGAGSWRRDPAGKWALTPARLAELTALQAQILDQAQARVAPQGHLAYATCSLLSVENDAQASAFWERNPGWRQITRRAFTPLSGGDGFFLAVFQRA